MNGKFSKIFGLAKELGLSKDNLSAGAAQWSGQASLRSLSATQLRSYEHALRKQVMKMRQDKKSTLAEQFESNAFISAEQRDYLIDLIVAVFNSSLSRFRTWLKNYFSITSERFLDSGRASQVITALNDMRWRGFKACRKPL